MAQDTLTPTPETTTNALTPEQQLVALASKVSALSTLALELTRLGIEINSDLPAVVQAHIEAAIAHMALSGPQFFHSAAISPDDLEAQFPLGYGDTQAWHVVCVGRRPSLYASAADADDQVRGVPNQSRKKKDSRAEALLYYRSQYQQGECERVSEAAPASHAPVPTARS
ncbi:hypothetical protein K438DRAFT_1775792 [Mycena galopus ATCC 62051]|nr:hypothetical protein K438DRAFT_1775792 [Mycena galopus ATCC 62051]